MSAVGTGWLRSAAETAEMVKLQHTVFALPFAVIGLVTATSGLPPLPVWLWVGVAMVGARTAAMAFNRLADHRIDALNPRTRGRALPAGRLGRGYVWTVVVASAALLVLAAAMLNPLCLALSPAALAVVLGYSYSKRFTSLSHLWLGAALGIAPIGAWIAAAGSIAPAPFVLAAGVVAWVGGFDVIYSLQDEAFDRAHELRSIPAVLGPRRALLVARLLHTVALVCFACFAALAGGGPLRFAAIVLAALLLVWQHRLVSPGDLSRVDAAFFTANGVLSVVMGVLFVVAEL